MTRTGPSPEWDQNLSALLDGLYAGTCAQIRDGRNLTDQQLERAMSLGWLLNAKEAQSLKLIDAGVDLPALDDHLRETHAGEIEWGAPLRKESGGADIDPSNPLALMQLLSKSPARAPSGPAIAVLHIDGTIVDGDSSSGGLFGGGGSTGSRTIRNALEDIQSEDEIRAVVVRINSPGGSATASEVIWQGLRRVAATRPVWVSVGGMAASGGYYCAVAGDKVYVNPSSIVGSIGVVGGRLSLEGLYDKVKLHVVARSRGPNAALFRSTGAWTDAEREMVRERMTQTYDLFASRVAAGRKGIDLAKTAEGRLFVGSAAVKLGMADKVGGLHEAIEDIASSVGLSTYEVKDYPAPKALGELLKDAAKGFGVRAGGTDSAAAIGAIRAAVGERAWPQVRDALGSLMQLRSEPVLLATPTVLIER